MQRKLKTFEIPKDIDTKHPITTTDEGCKITWSDDHESTYTWDWLRSVVPAGDRDDQILENRGKLFWNGTIANEPPVVDYRSVMSTDNRNGLAKLTENISVHGFCFVRGTPVTPEATKELLESIGPIRHTHYGGFYDFTSDLAKADTAYTNLALALHTDTTYFSEPAGLQAFHLLSHTPPTDGSGHLGGESILVDGFYAAHRLRKEFPTDYNELCRIRVPWHASGNVDVAIAPDQPYPVIETRRGGKIICRVRWNNDDRGVVPIDDDVSRWYNAARMWDEILNRRVNQYQFQMVPGRVLIFDNWRILHGRSAFKGHRRICGAYINRDDFISRWKLSNFDRGHVISANMNLKC